MVGNVNPQDWFVRNAEVGSYAKVRLDVESHEHDGQIKPLVLPPLKLGGIGGQTAI